MGRIQIVWSCGWRGQINLSIQSVIFNVKIAATLASRFELRRDERKRNVPGCFSILIVWEHLRMIDLDLLVKHLWR
jgi:hypothetical protein